jgi:hypothetical protein
VICLQVPDKIIVDMASLEEFLQFKKEIDTLISDIRKVESPSSELQERIEKIRHKMEGYWEEESSEPQVEILTKSDEALLEGDEIPEDLLVKQVGDALRCPDCKSEMPCACFSHLPDPQIRFEADGLFKVEFPEEYNSFDRANWLSAMRLVIAQKRGK